LFTLNEMNKNKRVTIYDIAKEAGVSTATVSRAISGKGYVSEETKKKIFALVDKYKFQPNTFAQNLQLGFSKTIGFIVPHIGNMYFASVYYEFEKWASLNGYMTILLNAKNEREMETRLLQSLREKQVDGIVIMGGRIDEVNLDKRYIKEINDLNKLVPCVLCSEMADRFECSGVYVNDKIGIRLLLEHLYSKGYRNIYMIGGSNSIVPSYLKKQYAIQIASELNITINTEKAVQSSFDYESGYRDMLALLQEKKYPDAVLCINDYVAIGALKALNERGLRVPQDIAVTGYDNVGESFLVSPKITTINPNYPVYGKKVFDCLQDLIVNPTSSKHETLLLVPELVVRDST